jgi:hypothetical protein
MPDVKIPLKGRIPKNGEKPGLGTVINLGEFVMQNVNAEGAEAAESAKNFSAVSAASAPSAFTSCINKRY